jgi:recombination protein RecA
VPKAEIEGEMGDSHVGLQARLMSQALRKLGGAIRHSNAAMIFTNQIRMKIGVMFGNPETTTGGNALKFYASVRLDMRRIGSIKGPGDVVLGNRAKVKVVKNKIAPPFRLAEFDILFGQGIDRVGDLVDLGANAGVVEKNGSWLSWKGNRLGQGKEKACEFLRQNADLLAALEGEVRLAVGMPEGAKPAAASAGAKPEGARSEAVPTPDGATPAQAPVSSKDDGTTEKAPASRSRRR